MLAFIRAVGLSSFGGLAETKELRRVEIEVGSGYFGVEGGSKWLLALEYIDVVDVLRGSNETTPFGHGFEGYGTLVDDLEL